MSAQAEQLQQTMAFFKLAGRNFATAPKTAITAGPRTKSRIGGTVRLPGAVVASDLVLSAVATGAPDESKFSRF